MSDNTPHGQADDDRRAEETTSAETNGAERTTNGSAPDEHGQADHTDVIEPAAANETDVFPRADDQQTSQYTAPYPTAGDGRQGSASDAGQQGGYGQDAGRYGQGSQYGSGQSSQYGQAGQYGSGQSSQYGSGQSSQYGSGQTSQYGQASQYGQSSQNGQTGQYGSGQYGPGQYGSGQYGSGQYGSGQQGQYGQQNPYGTHSSAYGQQADPSQQNGQDRPRYGEYAQQTGSAAAPASASAYASAQAPGSATGAPASASSFGDVDGSNQRNGHYFADSATAAPAGTKAEGRGRLVLPLVAGIVIAGLVGGGAGWLAGSATGGNGTPTSSAAQGGNLTVNDYNNATVVTAVAAQATPSVVTINVSASSEAGTGSGVVFSKDGYIVTNTHVVTLDGDSGNGKITVTTSDGKIYDAKLIGTDPTVDLAVIKIDATDMKPISFADSSDLNVGDTAVAIGAPLGLSNTVTDGIVSTLNRSIQVTSSAPNPGGDSNEGGNGSQGGPFDFWGNGDNGSSSSANSTVSLPVIQTDASINPGNSGGALLDSKGKLIGINVAIASAGSSSSDSQSGSIGVGFSIPSNLVKRVANEIKDNGSATHGLLGAGVADSTDASNATQMGALIKSVTSGGAAAKAGLKAGDVVTKIGSATVSDATDLTAQVRFFAGGTKTEITYLRGGKSYTADVTLGTYDSKG